MMKKILRIWAVGLSFFLLPLGTQAQVKTVKVAATSKDVVDNLPLFVGVKNGYFEEAGQKLDISYFRGGGEVVRAITTKSVDIGATPAASAVFIAVSRGEPIKIVSGSGAPMAGVVWIVAADSPIKFVKDLKGKKVGFSSPGSLTHTVIEGILRQEGLSKDVELVRVGTPGDSWAAIKNRIVDSGWHAVPAVYNLTVKKEARVLFHASDYIKEYQQTIVVAMEDVIKKDPDMIRNFLKARARAVKFIQDNPGRTISIWAEELSLPVEVTRQGLQELPKGYFETGAPKMANLMASLKETIDTGAVKTPPDVLKMLDTRFLP